MKKLAIAIGLGIVLLLAGCTVATSPAQQPVAKQPPTSDVRVVESGSTTTEYNIPVITSLVEGFGVKGDTVTIKDLYPCYSGTVNLEIINGQDKAREFHLSIVPENENKLQGYEQLPAEYYSWFTIETPVLRLMPDESRVVTINILMPCDANYPDKKARCRLLVEDWSQTGLVQIAVASKWYIETY